MEIEILPNSCRVCLKEGNKLKSLYSSNDDEETPCEMLRKLTGIQLEEEHNGLALPKHICRNCICELHLSFQFLEKVLNTQAHIEKFIRDINASQASNDVEKHIAEECVIKEEKTELYSTTNGGDCFDNGIEYQVDDYDASFDNKKPLKQKKILTKRNRICNGDEQFLAERNTKLSTRGRKPKKLTEEELKSYICDICGNVFSKRGRLTEHRRRHETEPKFACEICDERFLMRELLRRHMYQHTGGKPYKCTYCSRTFFYESVRRAHEAIHAGHKPYVCEHCNKPFAYAHALKKHKLIHADIKLYHCAYCNKDFRLQHHMKQHLETKMHQNTVQSAKNAKRLNTK